MTNQMKAVVLAALLLGWIVLVMSYVMEAEPQRVPLAYKTGTVAKQGRKASSVKRPLLVKAVQPPPQNIKNIFAPLDRADGSKERSEAAEAAAAAAAAAAEARRAKRLAKTPPPVVQAAAPTPAPPPPPPVAPPPPQGPTAAQKAGQELGEYRFLGYLVKRGESMAFLEKGHEIYIVKTGDVVNRAVQVKTIEPGFVKLVDARTAVEATIPLTKPGTGAS